MSGPVSSSDAPPEAETEEHGPCEMEVTDSRATELGVMPIRRALPRRGRRTVGAWCFVDHMGPAPVTQHRSVDIGPHPHIGLQTVTWLVSGEILHRDSLGSEQVIRPGQLNLMTAGNGIAHSEEATGTYAGEMHGVQFWVAQPEATRHGAPAFEHHVELPVVEVEAATATVLVGDFGGSTSPARCDTEHVGVDLALREGSATLELRPDFEYALVVLDGAIEATSTVMGPGHLGYLGTGRSELTVTATTPTRAMLIGGVPFPDPLVMWWNYVARTRDEVVAAHHDWTTRAPRFGPVASPLSPVDVAPPPWTNRSSTAQRREMLPYLATNLTLRQEMGRRAQRHERGRR